MKITMDNLIFPYKIKDPQIIYLDNATMPQKPKEIIDFITKNYQNLYLNPHKSSYTLAKNMKEKIEEVREKIALFLGVNREEIFFTYSATFSLKKIVEIFNIKSNDNEEFLYSKDDHLKVVDEIKKIKGKLIEYELFPHSGDANWQDINKKITKKTKIIFLNHIHGIYGLASEPEKIKKNKSFIFLDISHSIGKIPINLKKINVDMAVFSGYKIFAPEGIGICYLSNNLQKNLNLNLDELKKIFEEKEVSYLNIISLGKCVDLIKNIGLENIKNYLLNLTQLFINDLRFEDEEKIEFLPGVFYAKCSTGYGIISFKFKKIKNSDVLPIFEKNKIYLRLSNHCYHKSENKFDQIIRVSIHINNRLDEIKKTTQLIKEILKHSP